MEELLKKLGVSDANAKPEVAKNLDFSSLVLTPEEAFLLSRIDAAASLHEVLQTSTFPPDQTIRMLGKFAVQGLVVAQEKAKPRPRGEDTRARVETKTARVPLEPAEGLDLEFCFAIEDEYVRLENKALDAAEVLGLRKNAGFSDAKKAYLSLTKKFHPDRLFRKNTGAYLKRLDFIFRRVNEAFEEIQRGGGTKQREVFGERIKASPPAGKSAPAGKAPPVAGERVKAKVVPNPVMNREARSRQLLKDAQAISAKDPVGAASTLRLAASLDPSNAEIKKLLSETEGRANFRKAIKHFEEAQNYEDMLAFEKAGEAYEKAAAGDPKNCEYQRACGEFLLYKLKEPKRALPYAKRACELEASIVENHLLHGFILKALTRTAEAINVFDRVLQLDKSNLFAKNEIAQLRKSLVLSDKKHSS